MPRLQSWQLSPHACNTGADQDWSLTSLKEKLLKIGAKVVSHGRYARFTNGGRRHPTTNVPGDTAANRGTTAAATTRAVQEQSTGGMRPVKIARSAPRSSSGLPELLVAIHTSRQSCGKAGKARIFALVCGSSEESRAREAQVHEECR